ncbi:MAG: phosphoglycerate kinase [Candidatus Saganbacteria bacterium]|nr:phosphoglycerate kinase [Candidatus Saganbacteria bacterium]
MRSSAGRPINNQPLYLPAEKRVGQWRFGKIELAEIGKALAGKRVLIRCDLSRTVDGDDIVDSTAIRAVLDSVLFALRFNAGQIILLSEGPETNQAGLAYVARFIQEELCHLGFRHNAVETVYMQAEFGQPIESKARIVLLKLPEDSREESELPEEQEDFASEIYETVRPDHFVLDDFSLARTDRASVSWLASVVRSGGVTGTTSYVMRLSNAGRDDAIRRFAVVGMAFMEHYLAHMNAVNMYGGKMPELPGIEALSGHVLKMRM